MIESFNPIFDKNCKLLILGSCPSVKSLQKGEYYGHPQNRFWRVMFRLLDRDFTADYAAKKQMLLCRSVGLWDTIGNCVRVGSLDSSIKDVVPNDIAGLIKDSKVQCIALNGGKAKQVFLRQHKNSLQFFDDKNTEDALCLTDGKETEKGVVKQIGKTAQREELFFAAGNKKIKVVFLPSTSPANAKMSFEALYQSWYDNLKEYL